MAYFGSYDRLSQFVAKELRLAELLAPIGAEALAAVQTFEEVERRIYQGPQGTGDRWPRCQQWIRYAH
jgi:hypothetical protein